MFGGDGRLRGAARTVRFGDRRPHRAGHVDSPGRSPAAIAPRRRAASSADSVRRSTPAAYCGSTTIPRSRCIRRRPEDCREAAGTPRLADTRTTASPTAASRFAGVLRARRDSAFERRRVLHPPGTLALEEVFPSSPGAGTWRNAAAAGAWRGAAAEPRRKRPATEFPPAHRPLRLPPHGGPIRQPAASLSARATTVRGSRTLKKKPGCTGFPCSAGPERRVGREAGFEPTTLSQTSALPKRAIPWLGRALSGAWWRARMAWPGVRRAQRLSSCRISSAPSAPGARSGCLVDSRWPPPLELLPGTADGVALLVQQAGSAHHQHVVALVVALSAAALDRFRPNSVSQ